MQWNVLRAAKMIKTHRSTNLLTRGSIWTNYSLQPIEHKHSTLLQTCDNYSIIILRIVA